jgi:hypothetical protein
MTSKITLTPAQRTNWEKVFEYMLLDHGFLYCHSNFENIHSNATHFCLFSFIIRTPNNGLSIIGDNDYFGHYSDDAEYQDELNKKYCDDFFPTLADGGSDFEDFMLTKGFHDEDHHDTHDIVKLLREFLGMTSKSHNQYFTVHWKSNSKDRFGSEQSLREYFDLNPHRTRGYRKITVTKQVERIVYDEVEEAFNL